MRFNFALGLLGGIFLASLIIAASGYSQGVPALTPTFSSAASRTVGTTAITSSTTTTATSSSSSATQNASGAGLPTLSTHLNSSTSSATSTTSAAPAASNTVSGLVSYNSQLGPVARAPSSLAAIVDQPWHIPLLLIPVLAALLLGFVIYKSSVQAD